MGQDDTSYLKATVGEALAEGCAAVLAANPKDPIEYLALYLQRVVKSSQVEKAYRDELSIKAHCLEDKEATKKAAEEKVKAYEQERQDSLDTIPTDPADAFQLWNTALAVCMKHTNATAGYVANVVDPDEPEPEVESISADLPPEPEPEPTGEGGEVEGEAEAAAEEGEGEKTPSKPSFNYSSKFLQYIVASAGQEWIVEDGIVLRRPPPPPEEPEEGYKQSATPFTFTLLDKALLNLYVPNVGFQPKLMFFKRSPLTGAYMASPVTDVTGEAKALLCVDSLKPAGLCTSLSEEDRSFIGRVVTRTSVAIQSVRLRQEAALAEARGAALAARVRSIAQPAPPAAPAQDAAPEDGAAPAAVPEPEDAAAPPSDNTPPELRAARAALSASQVEVKCIRDSLAEIVGVLPPAYFAEVALPELLLYSAPPQATLHALKAALLTIGFERIDIARGFPTFRSKIQDAGPEGLWEQLIQQGSAMMETLSKPRRRSVIAHLTKLVGATKQLEKEMPTSCLGVVIHFFLKQAVKLSNASLKLRKAEEEEAKLAQAAAEAKAAAEAEAASAAAEAAAAAAAEASAAQTEADAAGAPEAE